MVAGDHWLAARRRRREVWKSLATLGIILLCMVGADVLLERAAKAVGIDTGPSALIWTAYMSITVLARVLVALAVLALALGLILLLAQGSVRLARSFRPTRGLLVLALMVAGILAALFTLEALYPYE